MTSLPPIAKDTSNAPLLLALKGAQTERVPVWFMRQAGRSLPEYRALRPDGSILEAVKQPGLAAEITMQPVRRYGVDAAILYSDIVVPVHAAGFGIDIAPGRGPVAESPFSCRADLNRLAHFDAHSDCAYVAETVRLVRAESDVPLIGFAGAPFTVASYLIEGGPSRSFVKTKQMMYADPALFDALLARLAEMTVDFLSIQVEAGAQAIQLFDSWVGSLSRREFARFVLPHLKSIFARLDGMGVPTILFGTDTDHLLELMGQAEPDAIGLDHRSEIGDANRRLGGRVALQGNLDPVICLTEPSVIAEATRSVLRDSASARGYVFNLGHGVLPETDPTKLRSLVELVHSEGTEIRRQALEET